MYYANDEYGKRVHIEESECGTHYYCPVCGGEVLRKIGKVISSHYAHKSATNCDPWYQGNKGEWHRHMQSLFMPQQQEVLLTDEYGERHIADVYLNGGRVIEFQHSALSCTDYFERTIFYSVYSDETSEYLKTYKPNMIWVFDCVDNDIYATVNREEHTCSLYWKRKIKTFDSLSESDYRKRVVQHKNNTLVEYMKNYVFVFLRISVRPYFIEKKESEYYTQTGEYMYHSRNVYDFDEASDDIEIGYVRLWHPWRDSKHLRGRYYTEEEFEEDLKRMSRYDYNQYGSKTE